MAHLCKPKVNANIRRARNDTHLYKARRAHVILIDKQDLYVVPRPVNLQIPKRLLQ
jgi:hypothetical protein